MEQFTFQPIIIAMKHVIIYNFAPGMEKKVRRWSLLYVWLIFSCQAMGQYKSEPCWSPDGQLIAFVIIQNGNADIYTMKRDGADMRCITAHPANDWYPRWSPDGKEIAFWSDRDGNGEIYLMSIDGSNPQNITEDPAEDAYPCWSPDGRQIAFVSDRSGNSDIFTISRDGTDLSIVIDGTEDETYPSWSPNGLSIVYRMGPSGARDIYKKDLASGEIIRITQDGTASSPFWSPDGSLILFNSQREGQAQVFSINADGSNVTRLTRGFEKAYYGQISPADRDLLLFRGDGVKSDIFILQLASGKVTQLTQQQ